MRSFRTGCYSNNVSIAVVLAFVLLTQAGCKWLDRVTYMSPEEQCLKNKAPGTEMQQLRCLAERVHLDSVRYENAYEEITSSRKEGEYNKQDVDWAAGVLTKSLEALKNWYSNNQRILLGREASQVHAIVDIIEAAAAMEQRISVSTGGQNINARGTHPIQDSRGQIDAALGQLNNGK